MFFTTINKLTSGVKSIIAAIYSTGGSPGFGRGGGQEFFFRATCCAWLRHALC